MISKTVINTKNKKYHEIKEDIFKNIERHFLSSQALNMLENIIENNDLYNIIIENPYYDTDYLSTFYCFYVKKHKKFIKECVRIHFFGNNSEYFGYMSLRPTVENTNIGKTYLSPKLYLPQNSRVMYTKFDTHIFGYNTSVNAFPWMQQETDIAVCAHVAIWSVLRYYGTKYPNYKNVTMGNVVEQLPEDIERKIPTSAVSMQKIPDIFKIMGFSPIVLSKNIVGIQRFQREMFTYIDSGIPVIACMTGKRHAIAVLGYTKYDKQDIARKLDNVETVMYNEDIIKEIIVNDDNYPPYLRLGKKKDKNAFDDSYSFSKDERFIEDIDFLIIPLYDRMQYNYSSLNTTLKTFLENEVFLDKQKKYIIKEYIASANSIKAHASFSIKNVALKNTVIDLTMPRFVWCVDFISLDNVKSEKIFARIIVDTTCCNKAKQPWLLLHNDHLIRYKDDDQWKQIDTSIEPYQKFENLKEVK